MSLVFTSDKNYLKLAAFQPATMNKPSTPNAYFNYESSLTITHNLGYIPLVRAYYDYNNAGTIYPCTGQAGVRTAFGPSLDYWFYIDEITTTTVTFKAEDVSSRSGTFTIYYKIYYDFEA